MRPGPAPQRPACTGPRRSPPWAARHPAAEPPKVRASYGPSRSLQGKALGTRCWPRPWAPRPVCATGCGITQHDPGELCRARQQRPAATESDAATQPAARSQAGSSRPKVVLQTPEPEAKGTAGGNAPARQAAWGGAGAARQPGPLRPPPAQAGVPSDRQTAGPQQLLGTRTGPRAAHRRGRSWGAALWSGLTPPGAGAAPRKKARSTGTWEPTQAAAEAQKQRQRPGEPRGAALLVQPRAEHGARTRYGGRRAARLHLRRTRNI